MVIIIDCRRYPFLDEPQYKNRFMEHAAEFIAYIYYDHVHIYKNRYSTIGDVSLDVGLDIINTVVGCYTSSAE